jgi:phosphate transport system substrate-binding protein
MKQWLFFLTALALGLPSCGKREQHGLVTFNARGSDTMVQLSTAWSEAYGKKVQGVQINASGGGSGTGIAALQNGTIDLAFSSREMKKEEKEKLKAASGKDAVEFHVAYDALAVYTHPNNPIKEISIPELREMWAEGGTVNKWEQLNPSFPGDIRFVGRQNNSGTYDYFREHICGKTADGKQREFRGGISELGGSAEVVETVARTPTAIGYSGMGYKNPKVNWLKVSNKKGDPTVEPGTDAARTGTYPISRKLYMYTAGQPVSELKAFVDWCLGPEGQAIVTKEGFVPLR